MVKNGVKVVIRTRPTSSFAQNQIQIDQDENTITVHNAEEEDGDGPSNRKASWKFRYHQVLHNAGQDTVYQSIAHDIVQSSVVEGINGTVLAYGQTGAGKTFTMMGDHKKFEYRGVAPRAVAQVFHTIEERMEISYTVQVSYLEIYNDKIYDLLESDSKVNKDYVIVEDSRGTSVRGLTRTTVKCEKDCLDAMFLGQMQRTVASHSLNKHSNRSHCIFTFYVSQKSRVGGSERVVHSKLNLVDLAGSERLKKTMNDELNDSTTKKESMYINQSLTFLEQCIVALGAKEQRHIPYRQTKLTNVLKDSLGGNSNTLMFACIWGESKHLEETISTLKLAHRMMRVQNETSAIVETDPLLLLKKYERQVKELKQELNMHDALVERTGVVYDEHTPEQIHELSKMVRRYVDAPPDAEDGILEFTSVQQIRQLFKQCKIFIRNAESCAGSGNFPSSRSGTAQSSKSIYNGTADNGMETHPGDDKQDMGENDQSNGFGVGVAPDAARPTTVDSTSLRANNAAEDFEHTGAPEMEVQDAKSVPDTEKAAAKTQLDFSFAEEKCKKNDAFLYYRNNSGKKSNDMLVRQKEHWRLTKEQIKTTTIKLNQIKEQLDCIKDDLAAKKQNKQANEFANAGIEEEVVDEEEFLLMKEERDLKKQYRSLFEELKELRERKEASGEKVERLKVALIEDFESWHRRGGRKMDENDDKLDDGEQFDQMEMERVFSEDPESLAFFQAQKKMLQNANMSSPSKIQQRRVKR